MTSGAAGRQRRRSSAVLLAILLPATLQLSCVSENAVGKFAASSVAALQKGDLVLGDMNGSCERAVRAQQPIGRFVLDDDTVYSLGICTDQIHTKDVLAISKVLIAYFSALGELASSGASSKPAAQEASKSASAIQTKPAAMEEHMKPAPMETKSASTDLQQAKSSATSIAKMLEELATEHLRQKALKNALTESDADVANLTQVLEDIVREDYLGELLTDERDKEANRFTRLANNPSPKPAFADLLTLNAQWEHVSKDLQERTAAAHAYIEALQQIRNGHAALVRQATIGKVQSKALDPALAPYSASLVELEPQIGRPF
jgi:pyruvate/2-oxoglutarate dehydrogenase complex dihydrolipoamide acyltransferase (E2) component